MVVHDLGLNLHAGQHPGVAGDGVTVDHFYKIAEKNHAHSTLNPLAQFNKRFTFDVDRPVTPLEHLIADHANGPQASRTQHYAEYATLVMQEPHKAAEMEAASYSIHFHTFTPASFAALLGHCRDEAGVPLALEALVPAAHEFVAVLRRWP